MTYVVEAPEQATADVVGGEKFPIRRIFCVGKNYAAHVREIGEDPRNTPPVFFTKPADAIVANGVDVPYAQATEDFHYEGELVLALQSGGREIKGDEAALACVYGYAVGCDLTRRDHQAAARKTGMPWDTAKAFDNSAPMAAIVPLADAPSLDSAQITTKVNGDVKQNAPLADMIWSIPEIIQTLSQQFELKAGDLIFTGTPEGIGPVVAGDKVTITVGELPALEFNILPAA